MRCSKTGVAGGRCSRTAWGVNGAMRKWCGLCRFRANRAMAKYSASPHGKARRRTYKQQQRLSQPGPCDMKGCELPRQQYSTGRYSRLCAIHKERDNANQRLRRLEEQWRTGT